MNLIQISNKVKTTKKGLGYFEIYENYLQKLFYKKANKNFSISNKIKKIISFIN